MSESYKNFDEEEGKEKQETYFNDNDDDDFLDAEDDEENTLFDRKEDLVGRLPSTRIEKRFALEKYLKDKVYEDPLSKEFLDNIDFKKSDTADDEISLYYKDEEVATIDANTGKPHRNPRKMFSSGYQTDYRKISDRRYNTFTGQIEQTIGGEGDIIDVVSDNIKKRFALEIAMRERRGALSDDIELVNLKEDLSRVERGKKVETDIGREILDKQTNIARRAVQIAKALGRVPIVGFLLFSVAGIITAIILLAKGFFYTASKSSLPPKKKPSKKEDFDPIQKAQERTKEKRPRGTLHDLGLR